MRYEIAIFDRSGEAWHIYRENYGHSVHFASRVEADTKARALSIARPNCQVLVITIHGGFVTETIQQPRPEPITTTTAITIP